MFKDANNQNHPEDLKIERSDAAEKEYIVTLKKYNDLDSFYNDMELENTLISSIPNRAVECITRRPLSRNTHYTLTNEEYKTLLNDPRIESIELHPRYLGIRPDIFLPIEQDTPELISSITEQTSTKFDKSNLLGNDLLNWALLRCYEGNTRPNWGSDGTANQTGTIKLAQTGKNVDVVIIDAGNPNPSHPEFAKNSDGTGGSRMIPFDWYQYDPIVKGTAKTASYSANDSDHSTHVSGTVAGNTQGWARSANIYNISNSAGGNNATTYDEAFSYVIDYVRAFHANKPINPVTGRKNPTICNNSWGWSLFPPQYYPFSTWNWRYITAVTYRGERIIGPEPAKEWFYGFYGFYSERNLLEDLIYPEYSGTRFRSYYYWDGIIPGTGSIKTERTSITNQLLGPASLTESTTPNTGNNDDGYWVLNLPFPVQYLSRLTYPGGDGSLDEGLAISENLESYYYVTITTGNYLVFAPGLPYPGHVYPIKENQPLYRKIFVASGPGPGYVNTDPDWGATRVDKIYYGTEGTAPNRTYRIRVEGTVGYVQDTGGERPALIRWEVVFYENTPNQIDLQIGLNEKKYLLASSSFTLDQLKTYGIVGDFRVPQRLPSIDADLKDAIADGIIFVGAAGNGEWYHDVPGGPDWNNSFEMGDTNPGRIYYYHKGTSPTANDVDIPNICVGAIDYTVEERRVYFSDCGPGVDIWAPGHQIMSSVIGNGPRDSRNNAYVLGKFSGTSMASPQVCGILACALEAFPDMKQAEAKEYITKIAKKNQLTNVGSVYADENYLNGAPNLYLYYKKEREETGNSFPKTTFKARPTSGAIYPRHRTKRRK
jgi:hypothetical protein